MTAFSTRIGIAATILAAGAFGLFAQAPPAATPADQAYEWIKEAQHNYKSAIKDYTCMFVSKENLKGKQGEDQFIQLKFRQAPFSVAMKWVAPAKIAGQEVCFVQGKNNNKLRVQSKGILGVAGFVNVDTDDPRVREQSRHTIAETGIGNLIDSTIKNWETDKRMGKSVTKIAEFNFDNRTCYRIETVRSEKLPQFYSYRSVIYLEKNSKYPLRNENYDWPVPGGDPNGNLMESFSYTGLQFNVGLTDRDFDK